MRRDMRSRVRRLMACGLILAAGMYVLYAGTLKHSIARGRNTHFFYAAGKCWLAGESPYSFRLFAPHLEQTANFPAQPFVYPPTVSVIAIPLALLPWHAARITFDCLNLAALAAACYYTARLIEAATGVDWRNPAIWTWIAAALIVLRPVVLCIHVAQIGLVALAGVLAALYLCTTGPRWACALAIVVASIKPQLSLLPLTYLVIAGGAQVLPVLALTALVGGATLAMAPLSTLAADLGDSLRRHAALDYNQWHNYANLPALVGPSLGGLGVRAGVAAAIVLMVLAALRDRWLTSSGGVNIPRLKTWATGPAATAPPRLKAWAMRQQTLDPWPTSSGGGEIPRLKTWGTAQSLPLVTLALILSASGLFCPLHDYDLGLYLPLMALLAVASRSVRPPLILGLLLLGRPGTLAAVLARLHVQVGNPYTSFCVAGTILVFLTCLLLWVRAARQPETRQPGEQLRPQADVIA